VCCGASSGRDAHADIGAPTTAMTTAANDSVTSFDNPDNPRSHQVRKKLPAEITLVRTQRTEPRRTQRSPATNRLNRDTRPSGRSLHRADPGARTFHPIGCDVLKALVRTQPTPNMATAPPRSLHPISSIIGLELGRDQMRFDRGTASPRRPVASSE
jgi:hypothetical protein